MTAHADVLTGGAPAMAVPFASRPGRVEAEWIDGNGHLNLAYTVLLLDRATDALWEALGLGASFRDRGRGTFAVETHTLYRAELLVGEETQALSWVLGCDAKRLHIAHELRRGPVEVAWQELLFVAVDLGTRRAAPWPPALRARLEAAVAAERPAWVGRRVGAAPP